MHNRGLTVRNSQYRHDGKKKWTGKGIAMLIVASLLIWMIPGCGGERLPELVRGGAIDTEGNLIELDPDSGTIENNETYAPKGPVVEQQEHYSVNYGDKLSMFFFGNKDLSGELVVRTDGYCTFPRIGDLFVKGQALDELTEILKEKYSQYYVEPDITISLKEASKGRFFVLGEVVKPGAYVLDDNITLLAGIAGSGGFKDSAELESIILIRSREPLPPESFIVNLEDVVNGEKPGGNPFLRPSDIIFVPKNFITKVDNFTDFLFRNILPPVDSTLRGYYFLNMVDARNREIDLIGAGVE